MFPRAAEAHLPQGIEALQQGAVQEHRVKQNYHASKQI